MYKWGNQYEVIIKHHVDRVFKPWQYKVKDGDLIVDSDSFDSDEKALRDGLMSLRDYLRDQPKSTDILNAIGDVEQELANRFDIGFTVKAGTEIKTLYQNDIEYIKKLGDFDAELAQHLNDGWEILHMAIIVTTPDAVAKTTSTDRVITLKRVDIQVSKVGNKTSGQSMIDDCEQVKEALTATGFTPEQTSVWVTRSGLLVEYLKTIDHDRVLSAIPNQYREVTKFEAVDIIFPF